MGNLHQSTGWLFKSKNNKATCRLTMEPFKMVRKISWKRKKLEAYQKKNDELL